MMSGETDLAVLLKSIQPILQAGEYVFFSISLQDKDWLRLDPIATFREDEGLTLVLHRECADQANLLTGLLFG